MSFIGLGSQRHCLGWAGMVWKGRYGVSYSGGVRTGLESHAGKNKVGTCTQRPVGCDRHSCPGERNACGTFARNRPLWHDGPAMCRERTEVAGSGNPIWSPFRAVGRQPSPPLQHEPALRFRADCKRRSDPLGLDVRSGCLGVDRPKPPIRSDPAGSSFGPLAQLWIGNVS